MQTQNRGIFLGLLLLGLSLIPVGDTGGKLLGLHNVDPIFSAWARLAVGFLILAPFAKINARTFKQLFHWPLLLRAVLFASAICAMLTALKTNPIADVFGIFFIGPIVAYFLAALLLKEKITLARSLALMLGFIGVLLVAKPNAQFNAGSLYALFAGVCYGCMLVCNRWLAYTYKPTTILVSGLFAGSLALAPFALPVMPTEVNNQILLFIMISSGASAIGNLLIIEASRHIEASIAAPFVYSQLLVATLLGIFVFNEWPDAQSTLGIFTIFISGVGSFWLLRKRPQ